MPQLDKVTFFTQIFWALFAYLIIYSFLTIYVCPSIGLVLKSRLRINLTGQAEEGFATQKKPSFLISNGAAALETSIFRLERVLHLVGKARHYCIATHLK